MKAFSRKTNKFKIIFLLETIAFDSNLIKTSNILLKSDISRTYVLFDNQLIDTKVLQTNTKNI